jgi:hypothetical protein
VRNNIFVLFGQESKGIFNEFIEYIYRTDTAADAADAAATSFQ